MKQRVITRLSLIVLLLSSTVLYAENQDIDALLEGFDEAGSEQSVDTLMDGFDNNTNTTIVPPESTTPNPLTIDGSIALKGEYAYSHKAPAVGATDFRGFANLKTRLGLKIDYDLNPDWRAHIDGTGSYDFIYSLRDNNYPQTLVDSDQQYGEIGEAWIRGTLNKNIDIKIGRQIVVWGKSDSLRVTDVINPIDNRTPGMADIEDIRLPLTMARVDLYYGDWGFKFMAIPEFRPMRLPNDGSEFDPFPSALPAESTPDNTEYAFAVNGRFSGWDLSLYYADLYDDTPHIAQLGTASARREYSRYSMSGIAANIVEGSWLFKGEFAHFDGIRYSGAVNPDYQRSDLLAGVEYSGIENSSLTIELTQSTVNDYKLSLATVGIEEVSRQFAIRYTSDLMYNRLHLMAMTMQGDWNFTSGGFSRLSAEYDLFDAMSVTAGVLMFHSGSLFPIGSYGDNDRIFIEAKYSF